MASFLRKHSSNPIYKLKSVLIKKLLQKGRSLTEIADLTDLTLAAIAVIQQSVTVCTKLDTSV